MPTPPALRDRTIKLSGAQANSDAEIPVFPSYSMPKALIFERVASAALKLRRGHSQAED